LGPAGVAKRLASAYPEAYDKTSGVTTDVESLRDELTRRARPTLLMLLATTVFVLVIASANVANLTLARMAGRDRELSVRAALGAGRGRIARQLLTESLLLSIVGGAAGLVLAWLAQTTLVSFVSRFTPLSAEVGMNGWVLAFTAAISIATGIAFGLVPAAPRRRDVAGPLNQTSARTVGGSRIGVRNALIASQVALS